MLGENIYQFLISNPTTLRSYNILNVHYYLHKHKIQQRIEILEISKDDVDL